jgi:peroxiredoxin
MDHLAEGISAPDLILPDLSGTLFYLVRALECGPLTLVFFKTTCPACDLTFPYLQRIHAASASSGPPRIWAVSQDSIDATRRFSAELALGMPFLVDAHPFPVSDDYAVRYVPTIYLIDRARRIRIADCGFSKPALREVNRHLARELGRGEPELFAPGDRRPERRPGCSSNN